MRLKNIVGGVLVGFSLVMSVTVFSVGLPEETPQARIQRIYKEISAQTGEQNLLPPVIYSDSDEVNAYATIGKVVIHKGLVDDIKNDDELALIIGHEIAHVLLGHIYIEKELKWDQISVLEAQADKMGAFYALKAGYDVCKARKVWLRWLKKGDYLFADHPNKSYRYAQLNVQCSDDL